MDMQTSEQRSKNMRAIRNKDTKIELMLRKELWSRGLRYQKNSKRVLGHPDIAFIGKRIAVFCDSEFWHGFNWEQQKETIKSRQDFWIPKIEKNMQRDDEVTKKLESDGWIVIRFWGKDIKNNVQKCADIIQIYLKEREDV